MGGGFRVENEGKAEVGGGDRVGTGKGAGKSMRTRLSKLPFSKVPFSFFPLSWAKFLIPGIRSEIPLEPLFCGREKSRKLPAKFSAKFLARKISKQNSLTSFCRSAGRTLQFLPDDLGAITTSFLGARGAVAPPESLEIGVRIVSLHSGPGALSILEILENLEILERRQTVENKGESDHFSEKSGCP